MKPRLYTLIISSIYLLNVLGHDKAISPKQLNTANLSALSIVYRLIQVSNAGITSVRYPSNDLAHDLQISPNVPRLLLNKSRSSVF
jgi:hypothetical protein